VWFDDSQLICLAYFKAINHDLCTPIQLLVSPMVSTRIYSNQMEQLLQLYQAYAVGGRMGLEEFAPVARGLLLMVYQNAYPDVVRVKWLRYCSSVSNLRS